MGTVVAMVAAVVTMILFRLCVCVCVFFFFFFFQWWWWRWLVVGEIKTCTNLNFKD